MYSVRKKISRVLVFIILFSCVSFFASPGALAVDTGVAKETIILRSKASASSVPLATILEGKEVFVEEKTGEWYKVRTGSLTGYVMIKYINITKSGGVSATSTSGTISTGTVLRKDDKGDAVKTLQNNLKELGYFKEDATGNFGEVTQAAVIAFQKANGLTADGMVGSGTLSAIAQKLNASTLANTQSLKAGSEGDMVKQLQQALKEKGYFSEDVTGYYGTKTQAAVMAFQNASGITADGVAGKQTLSALLDSSTVSAVKKGDTGNAVKELQRLLKNSGFYTGAIDGNFGDGTQQALLSYQKAAGLSTDGVAGKQTISKLASGSLTNTSSSSASNVPVIINESSSSASSSTSSNNSSSSSSSSSSVAAQSNGSLRLVDWWSGEMNTAFPRMSAAQMLDIYSGITITVYRYGGTNHLDWEPATSADMAKVTQMVNGDYSWSARPVILITANGNRYAAAINTMPHGEYHINDNNCNGQMCMHFLNSHTHGGNAVNADMQNAIQIAFRHG